MWIRKEILCNFKRCFTKCFPVKKLLNLSQFVVTLLLFRNKECKNNSAVLNDIMDM